MLLADVGAVHCVAKCRASKSAFWSAVDAWMLGSLGFVRSGTFGASDERLQNCFAFFHQAKLPRLQLLEIFAASCSSVILLASLACSCRCFELCSKLTSPQCIADPAGTLCRVGFASALTCIAQA